MARSPRMIRLAVALAAGALVAGCGSSSSSSESDLERVSSSISDLMCQSYVSCNCMDASFVDDCKAEYKAYFKLYLGMEMAGSPGVKFDMDKFDACLADTKAAFATCPSTSGMFESTSCQGQRDAPAFLVGTQPQGDPCGSSISCAPGLSCDTTLGTCQDEARKDESCETVSCAAGLYCDGTVHCAELGARDATCSNDEQCQTGLICNQASQCGDRIAQGAPCSRTDQCTADHYCDTTCFAKKAGGAGCSSDSECLSDECSDSKCEAANFCSVHILIGG